MALDKFKSVLEAMQCKLISQDHVRYNKQEVRGDDKTLLF